MTKKLGLYIHIPFCIRKCNYCDFLSFGNTTPLARENYVHNIISEMKEYTELAKQYEVDTIFLGGGTPSLLEAEWMERLFIAVGKIFHVTEHAEISIECNPGTVTEDKLACYREYGVNRISIGLQSAQNEELKRLGRIHTFEEFEYSYELIRDKGFRNVNVDLMSGIPGQTIESYQDTCNKVLKHNPEHISAYSLIVEEGTPFYEEFSEQPPIDEQTDRALYHLAKQWLQEHEYERYEISNYAKSGYECRHNLKYWENQEYLGIGLGAVSRIGDVRYTNGRTMERYTARERELEQLSYEDKVEEYIFLGLRKTKGISKKQFMMHFHKSVDMIYGDLCDKLESQGLLVQDGNSIRLTERGTDISNYVMSQFILTDG